MFVAPEFSHPFTMHSETADAVLVLLYEKVEHPMEKSAIAITTQRNIVSFLSYRYMPNLN